MLKTYTYSNLDMATLARLCTRNTDSSGEISAAVNGIIQQVNEQGDEALIHLAQQFDGIRLRAIIADSAHINAQAALVPEHIKQAISVAYQNIYSFHTAQLVTEKAVETMPGVRCWRENRAIERVGLYVPGGSAILPSTLLMLGIPAKIAGCKEIVVCTPPQKDGTINSAISYVLQLLGIDNCYMVGGAQAIAAMAIGTTTIPKCSKLFGPGNRYVTQAKIAVQAQFGTAIDMPAGPSEVLVIADDSANAAFVAADLLAQAEHGADSQAVLVSNSALLIEQVNAKLEKQVALLPRKDIATKAIANSYAVLTDSLEESIDFSNAYAPEHLLLQTVTNELLIPKISNAGSVFIGHYTPESAGDYASGTNHTLPTSGFAKAYSGVSVDSFVKKITFQAITPEGLKNIGPTIETLATLEGLQAHKNAVTIRYE